MNRNLKLVINNVLKDEKQKYFFEKKELKVILDLYAKMVSEGSWKDYGLSISSKQVSFIVFKNAAENAMYKICKNFKPSNKNLRYLITDTNGKILKKFLRIKIFTKQYGLEKVTKINYLLWPNNLKNIINKLMKSKYNVNAPITAFLPINSPESEAAYIFLIF